MANDGAVDLTTLIASLGSLAIGLAPLWGIHLADLPEMLEKRRAMFVAFLIALMIGTGAAGVGWLWFWSRENGSIRPILVAFALVVLFGSIPAGSCDAIVRRRRVRRRLWREAHADEDVQPQNRRERRIRRDLDLIVGWQAGAQIEMARQLDDRGWVTTSCIEALDRRRPLSTLLPASRRGAVQYVSQQSPETRRALQIWVDGVGPRSAEVNAEHLRTVAHRRRGFFDSVERSPLTGEQIEAVVCLDDRVRLIAAAGSGKTSTLVAKAAYAVAEGLVPSDRVLVLAFNDAAAGEARHRLRERLQLLGLSGDVEVRTFHSLGSKLVGTARNRKPALATAVAQNREVAIFGEIVADLCRRDERFAGEWALFRAVFADADLQEQRADERADEGLLTRSGDRVRSRGEQLIADWLWFQGVEFEYERPYSIDTADASHRQYIPDFYYPGTDLWHEHLALDAEGAAPEQFDGYSDGVDWKRSVHQRNGTRLIETTMAQIDDGTIIDRLAAALVAQGVAFQPDAARPARGRPILPDERVLDLFAKAVRTAKRDGISAEEYDRRVASLTGGGGLRARSFGRLLAAIRVEWDERLTADGTIDFEGMVVEAAEALESGRVAPQYDLVLVDEFQDMNPAFTRILQGLLQRPGSRLFAVGDDWQAINGFAGAEPGALLDFSGRFGTATTLRLERTFRSSQAICDVAGAFVMQNPAQLTKQVVSDQEQVAPSVRIRVAGGEARQTVAMQAFLDELQRRIDGARAAGRDAPDRSVLLLGRYKHVERLVPDLAPYPALHCTFSTIHQAKGREADYVVLLDAVGGSDGFPSTKRDDPVLALLTSGGESFPHAEERRLLYVALTRARRAVVLITARRSISPFVTELSRQPGVRVEDELGDDVELCPSCGQGVLEGRTSKYGSFTVCSRPQCEFKQDARRKTSDSAAPWREVALQRHR